MRIFSLFIVALIFFGCSNEQVVKQNPLELSFEELKKSAQNTDVSIYMWGGSKEVNNYFDNFVIPKVKVAYGITLNRIPIDDVKSVLQKIDLELNAKEEGHVDIIWLNGENFKLAKDKGLLYAPFVSKLPNYNRYVDTQNQANTLDFSEPTEGLEAPFGRSQFVMVYNSKNVKTPPRNYQELFEWIKNNPNRFTYPVLPDFTASAFVRNLFIDYIGGMKNFDKNTYEKEFLTFSKALNELKPYMFQKADFLPKNAALLDILYKEESVDFTFSYNPSHAPNQIKNSSFPKESRTFLFDGGSLANTHFLTISKNAPNVEGAMVVINYLLSPFAQLEKAKSDTWGDGTVLDLEKLDKNIKEAFLNLTLHESLLNYDVLQQNQIPELNAQYIENIEKLWRENVLKK